MKIDLNKPFVDMKGQPIEGDTQAKFLAGVLAGKFEDLSPIKAFDYALKLFNDGEIEIDASDLDAVKNGVKKLVAQGVSNLVCAQLERSLSVVA